MKESHLAWTSSAKGTLGSWSIGPTTCIDIELMLKRLISVKNTVKIRKYIFSEILNGKSTNTAKTL